MVAKPVVLVVEDEPLLRLFATDMIEDAGFEVIDVAHATDAIAILETRPDIRVVFTDVDMPGGIDGIKLAACIRDRWPPIEIIITSGVVPGEHVALPARGVFYSKPYDPAEVVTTMKMMAART